MAVKDYLLSFPERFLRATLGLGAGVAREVGEVALPEGVRRSQLYQNLVDATLRYLIEQVGGVESLHGTTARLPERLSREAGCRQRRRGARHHRLSRLASLGARRAGGSLRDGTPSDTRNCRRAQGAGPPRHRREVHQRRSDAGWPGADLVSSGRDDQHAAARCRGPPTGMAGNPRRSPKAAAGEPAVARDDRQSLGSTEDPIGTAEPVDLRNLLDDGGLAVRALPEGVRWLSASARVGATRTGQVFAAALLDHYTQTLREIQETGYVTYAAGQLRPYVRAAVDQFSPTRRTLTQQLLERIADMRRKKDGQSPNTRS